MEFILDPRLASSSLWLCDFALSECRLMPDPQCPWLVLVPRRAQVTELHQLDPADQMTLMQEITSLTNLLKVEFQPDKINVGALGNIVNQLHVHIIGRYLFDRAWPGPLWGVAPTPDEPAQEKLKNQLQMAVAQHFGGGLV